MVKYPEDIVKYHSWGESNGISRILLLIANELAEMNRINRKNRRDAKLGDKE